MRSLYFAVTAYSLSLLIFSIVSYSLTDPNLVISNNELYWNFQTWMWQHIFNNSQYQGQLFALLFFFIIGTYCLLLAELSKQPFSKKILYALLTIVSVILFFSYNALSHDIFNYMFNAKMVLLYNLDPHTTAAIQVAHDDWLRFMHNVHTAAPYGYGWTAISLLPSLLGFGKFLLTYIAFKLWAVLSYILLVIWAVRSKATNLYLVFLNPLLLIEIISSGHNDLFMLVPAVISLYLFSKKMSPKTWLIATTLLLISISIKLATLVLIPLILGLILHKNIPGLKTILKPFRLDYYWPLYASLLMFLPLLTERSQQFHPWYLSWTLVWLLYFPQETSDQLYTFWKKALLVLSFSSLYRYIPWIYSGGFSSTVMIQQKMITWIPLLVLILIFGLLTFFYRKQKIRS